MGVSLDELGVKLTEIISEYAKDVQDDILKRFDETADEILDYLLSIKKASIKQYTAKRDGGYGFLQVCFNIQKLTKSICFILADNRYHYAQVMLRVANTNMRLFDRNEEVALIAIGEDSDFFMKRAGVDLESFVTPSNTKKEQPQHEDLGKKVDQCWDLYDQEQYRLLQRWEQKCFR